LDIFQSIILGIVQGITEFFPISSTAHLALVPWIFSWKDPGLSYNVALHFGSLFAIIIYFRKTWQLIITEFLRGIRKLSFTNLHYGRLGLFIIIATIPAVISGLLFEQYAAGILRDPMIIAASLFIFGLLLLYSNSVSKEEKSIKDISIRDSLIIGLAQAFAIIPGASRSGVTITYESKNLAIESVVQTPFLVGVTVSAIFAFLAIKYLLRFVRFSGYKYFVYYRIILAFVIVLVQMIS
jgi:undecaprenyl-diphosphatase